MGPDEGYLNSYSHPDFLSICSRGPVWQGELTHFTADSLDRVWRRTAQETFPPSSYGTTHYGTRACPGAQRTHRTSEQRKGVIEQGAIELP